MPRSTRVIALAGIAVLAIALGAAALRGSGGDTPAAEPTAQAPDGGAEATDTPAPTPSTTTSDAPTTEDTPSSDDTIAPTPDATDGPDDAPGDDDATDGGATGGAATGDDTTDGGVTDGETVAMGPTGIVAVDDTPRTGGGTLAVLGGAVAAGAIAVGRRPRR